MNLGDSKKKHSYFISAGPLTHRLSPFSEIGLGHAKHVPNELIFSSAWLWQESTVPHQPPRFSVGFPEEWTALISSNPKIENLFGSDSAAYFDFWIFRQLNKTELLDLENMLLKNVGNRIVVAPSYVFSWKDFLDLPEIAKHKNEHRVVVCFLPSQNHLSPFLREHDVLRSIKALHPSVDLLRLNISQNRDSFYTNIDSEYWANEVSNSSKYLIRTLRALDRWCLGHFISFSESLADYFISYRLKRLFSALNFLLLSFWSLFLKIVRFILQSIQFLFKILNFVFRIIRWPFLKVYWFLEYQFQKFTRVKK